MFSLLAILFLGTGLDTARPQPAMYLDSTLVNLSKTFIAPADVERINVDGKQNAVYVQLKPGTNVFLTLNDVSKKQSIDIQGIPVIYFVDGTPVLDTANVRIQEDYISKVTLTQTKDVPSARTAQSIALVMIETTALHPKPKPGEKTVILRGTDAR